jgi:spermidine synthase
MRDVDPGPLGLKRWLPPVLLGFLASSFEIYLMREFGAQFYGNELIFGFFLGAWLLWGGIGSLIRPPLRPEARSKRLAALYGAAVLLFFAGLVVLRFSHRLMGVLPAELTGLFPALGFALLLGLLVSLPLGHSFGLNASRHPGGVSAVYILESMGAAAAGLAVHFALIPHFTNWGGAAVVGIAAAVFVGIAMEPGRSRALLAAAMLLGVGLSALDLPSQKESWKPLRLIDARDTLYGKLQVIRTGEQVTLFDNGLVLFSHPNEGAAEEAVHFALLQRQGPRRALLVGGGPGGGAAEALKYPGLRVDCVEIDPAVVRAAKDHLDGPDRAALDDPRVNIVYRDGRTFIAETAETYDAILLSLPEPATAQINRYYTREFFEQARARLRPGGVLSFVVPSAENYISAPLGEFLGSLAATLHGVFAQVAAVPGENCVFLASDGPLTLDPAVLSAAIERLGLHLRFVSPGMLPARLDPARVEYLARKLSASRARINTDLFPVSYYFHAVLWAGQFRGVESRLLRAAARLAPGWILDAPLVVFGLVLAGLAVLRRRSAARGLVPVAVMGFTSITFELAVLVAFQARFGFVYGKIPLLLALFMAGLALGGIAARSRERQRPSEITVVQGGFVLLLGLAYFVLPSAGSEASILALLASFGLLGGYLFVSANRRLLPVKSHPGLGYGVDLLASFAGVILASGLIIPLFGVPALVLRLLALNALCFLYLLVIPGPAS